MPDPSVQWEPGRRVDITLEENPTTGYLWEVLSKPDGTEVINMQFSGSQTDEIGSGGLREFAVTSSHPGSVVFVLRRPWDKASLPIQKVTISIE